MSDCPQCGSHQLQRHLPGCDYPTLKTPPLVKCSGLVPPETRPQLETIFTEATYEYHRARRLFPETKHLLHAFTEEAGEVTKAYLDHHYKPGKPDERRKELIQTIAMALRLLVDGDPDFAPVPAP